MLIAQLKNGQAIRCHRELGKKLAYFCPGCRAPVIFRCGSVRLPHFAHQKNSCHTFSEGETAEHVALKHTLVHWGKCFGQPIGLEVRLPALNQRPDALLQQLAFEIQCSSLPLARLAKRRQTYANEHYRDWWLLGKNFFSGNFSQIQKGCCDYSKARGLHFWQIDYQKSEIRLCYQVSKTPLTKWQYHVKSWPFFKESLLTIFRWQPSKRAKSYSEPTTFSKSYRDHLAKQLYFKNKPLMQTQGILYQRQAHLLTREAWFYYPSRYFVFFNYLVMVLRQVSLEFKEDEVAAFTQTSEQLLAREGEPWPYFGCSRQVVLQDFFHESKLIQKWWQNQQK
jgi:competence protein CoiA